MAGCYSDWFATELHAMAFFFPSSSSSSTFFSLPFTWLYRPSLSSSDCKKGALIARCWTEVLVSPVLDRSIISIFGFLKKSIFPGSGSPHGADGETWRIIVCFSVTPVVLSWPSSGWGEALLIGNVRGGGLAMAWNETNFFVCSSCLGHLSKPCCGQRRVSKFR